MCGFQNSRLTPIPYGCLSRSLTLAIILGLLLSGCADTSPIGPCVNTINRQQIQITNIKTNSESPERVTVLYQDYPDAPSQSFYTGFSMYTYILTNTSITQGSIHHVAFEGHSSCGPGDVTFLDLNVVAKRPASR